MNLITAYMLWSHGLPVTFEVSVLEIRFFFSLQTFFQPAQGVWYFPTGYTSVFFQCNCHPFLDYQSTANTYVAHAQPVNTNVHVTPSEPTV